MSALTTAPTRRITFHPLTVAAVDRLGDDAVAVTFDVPAELSESYAFRAGQSLTLRRVLDGRDERRSYSICAPAGERPRIGVREVPGGLFSRWLVHEVSAGDVVEVSTPTGSFTPAAAAPGGRHVLVAAGSGITPVLSIAATVLRDAGSSVTLVYGNRRTTSVMFAEELADLKDAYGSRFELVHVLSREPREVELLSGRLDAERLRRILLALVPLPAVDGFWLCGPYELVVAARGVLADLGVDADRVHAELFHVDEPPAPVVHRDVEMSGPSSEVTVVLDGRSTTLTLPRDVPLLDSAQRVRADLPFACKGGVCGTCRAKVSSGEVDMRRNYALEADEVAKGFVLTCQSRPVSAAVTLDYDAS